MNTIIDTPRRLDSGTIVTTTEHHCDDNTTTLDTYAPTDAAPYTVMNIHPKGDCATEVLIIDDGESVDGDAREIQVGDINIHMTFEQYSEFRFAIERG